jgi:hypothetical protein
MYLYHSLCHWFSSLLISVQIYPSDNYSSYNSHHLRASTTNYDPERPSPPYPADMLLVWNYTSWLAVPVCVVLVGVKLAPLVTAFLQIKISQQAALGVIVLSDVRMLS